MAHVAPIALAAWLITAANSIALGAEGLTTLGVGADYSSGNYGASERTEIFYVPVTAKHETGRWALKLVVPYIRITGPSNVIGAAEGLVTLPGAGAVRRTETGLGDVVASAFYNALSERDASFGLDIGTKIKFGTADDSRGLGTGKNDFSLQADGTATSPESICATCFTGRSAPRTGRRSRRASGSPMTGAIESCKGAAT